MRDSQIDMIENFQCPGCVNGPSPRSCPMFKPQDRYGAQCTSHVPGTMMMSGSFALGLPKGFNRPGAIDFTKFKTWIRLWDEGFPDWDHLNVPVWAMEEDDHLFVRTFSPRLNLTYVDVIRNGTLDLVPNAVDVSEFIDEID